MRQRKKKLTIHSWEGKIDDEATTEKHNFLWLIWPEDSSNWEVGTIQSSSETCCSQGIILSVSKFLLYYAAALAAAFFCPDFTEIIILYPSTGTVQKSQEETI